jgi:tRNA/rRNA methyltransferase
MTLDPSSLKQIRIVLVEPLGALNVGSVARVMKNMGLSRLVLVNPQCDPWGEEAQRMAVHAQDVLAAAIQVDTVPDALVGCQRAIATTGRDRALPDSALERPEDALPWLLFNTAEEEAASLGESALMFGPEDRGLNNVELNYAQRFIRIPTSDDYPSLNLAQAVAICGYELFRITTTPQRAQFTEPQPLTSSASLDQLEGYYNHLERVLCRIGYLYPHTAESRMAKFRRLFHRMAVSEEDVSMLRGILRQTEWALQHPSAVAPFNPDQHS